MTCGHPTPDEQFMDLALEQARQAALCGEVPVGAVIVDGSGQVIASTHNTRESQQKATGHAELLAIDAACTFLQRWRLTDCTLYVTLEPCFMCAGATVLARIGRVVFATTDPKAGAVVSLANILSDPRLNHRCVIDQGIRAQEAQHLLQSFFRARRLKKETF